MSLGVVVKGPEGVVLAADTRVTLTAQRKGVPPLFVNFDNATKLLTFGEPHNTVGAVTYGEAIIGNRTAHSFIPEFELKLESRRLPIQEFAQRLSEFFLARWTEAGMPTANVTSGGMSFIVGGYDENQPYGKVFLFVIPCGPKPVEQNPNSFGMTWGGQLEIANRIIHGYDPGLLSILCKHLNISRSEIGGLESILKREFEYTIPYEVLPLQDCVDLATFLIRTTITAQNLAVAVRGVGGAIQVATITRTEGLGWVQKQELHGEDHYDLPHRYN